MEYEKIPKNKRNHFVPKALIARFRAGKGVRLFDASSLQLKERSNPNSIFYVDHLYSRWRSDGTRDVSAETELQVDHENRLTGFIDDLISGISRSGVTRLDQTEREYLIRLSVRLLLRNPQFVEWATNHWKYRVAKWLVKLGLKLRPRAMSAIKRSKLSVHQATESEIRAYAATFDISVFVNALSKERRVLLLTPQPGVQSFILGNQPSLLQRKKWFQDENGNWQSEYGAMDIYTVLDPSLMVGIVSTSPSDGVHHLSADDMKRINGLIVKYSDEVVARSASDLHGAWYRVFEGEEAIRSIKNTPEGVETVQLSVAEA